MTNYVLLILNMWIYIYYIYIIIYNYMLKIPLGWRDKGLRTTVIVHGSLYPLDVSKQFSNGNIQISGQ